MAPVSQGGTAQAAAPGFAVRPRRGRVHAGIRRAHVSDHLRDVGGTVARVRLFAALRDIAGTAHLDVPGDTVDEVVVALTDKFGERFGDIARAGSAVLAREAVGWDTRVGEDDELALLPPVSGGQFMPKRPERALLLVNPVARTVSRPVLEVI